MNIKEYKRKWNREKYNNFICIRCGKHNDRWPKWSCFKCALRESEHGKRRYSKRKIAK